MREQDRCWGKANRYKTECRNHEEFDWTKGHDLSELGDFDERIVKNNIEIIKKVDRRAEFELEEVGFKPVYNYDEESDEATEVGEEVVYATTAVINPVNGRIISLGEKILPLGLRAMVAEPEMEAELTAVYDYGDIERPADSTYPGYRIYLDPDALLAMQSLQARQNFAATLNLCNRPEFLD